MHVMVERTTRMTPLLSLAHLSPQQFETVSILKKLAAASRKLAELKGMAGTIPNQGILINTLSFQEAKDSSAIENIMTTHDEIFRDDLLPDNQHSPAGKEVLRYRQALGIGFAAVRESGLLTQNHILEIQAALEQNNAGFRRLPGTILQDSFGQTVYTPPAPDMIADLMTDLERFINQEGAFDADPLSVPSTNPHPDASR